MKTEILVKNVHGLRTATSVNENSGEVEHKLAFRVVMPDGDHDRLVLMFKQKVPVELLITAPSAKSDFQIKMVLEPPKPVEEKAEQATLTPGATVAHGEDSLTERADVVTHPDMPDLSKEPGTGKPLNEPETAICKNCGETFLMVQVVEGKCPFCELSYDELQPSDVIVASLEKNKEKIEAHKAAVAAGKPMCAQCGSTESTNDGKTVKCTRCGHEAPMTDAQAWGGIPSAGASMGPVPEPPANGKKPRRSRKAIPVTETAATTV